jgi:serine/threonine protein kinase/lipopolysaccharide biosynthesis regulator YciM
MANDARDPVPSGDPDLTRAPDSPADTTPSFGPYRLIQLVGEGGMGEVWLAEQTRPVRRQVALKIIKAGMDSKQVMARFEAERQALALMDHPSIAKVFDAGTTLQGRPFFAMEYVKGEPITTYCDRCRLSTKQRLALFIRVCEGVQHAHQKGIIHRDIKASNVLVTLQDDRPVPKIIDFGVAKATTGHLAERTVFTELGVLIGTPEYMSPEQADLTALDIDTRTDVYSLGVLLYELLTGALPFDTRALRGQALDEIRRTIREVDPPRPSTRVTQLGAACIDAARSRRTEPARLASELRGDLDWITMQALEKDRTRRYGTASEFAADIRRHLDLQTVLARPTSTVYRVRRFARRHRFGVSATATLILLLIAFGVAMAIQAQRIAAERDRANSEARRANAEAATAKQVSDFLLGLFRVADPSESRGNTLTAREIVDAGAAKIDTDLAGQPDLQVRMMTTIGAVYTSLGMFDAAAPLLERALVTARKSFAADHPSTVSAVHELANLYWYQGRLTDAEPLYLAVVQCRRRSLGEEHRDTLRASYDLASLYMEQRRWTEAERLGRATIETQTRVLGGDHPDTLDSISNLSCVYYRQGRYAEALVLEEHSTEVRRKTLGDDHPQTISGAHNLATIFDKMGRYDEAEAIYLKTIKGKQHVLGTVHPSTILTIRRLAAMYQKQGRRDEAASLLHSAFAVLAKSERVDVNARRSVVDDLSALYAAWGKPEKAAEWRMKLAKGS